MLAKISWEKNPKRSKGKEDPVYARSTPCPFQGCGHMLNQKENSPYNLRWGYSYVYTDIPMQLDLMRHRPLRSTHTSGGGGSLTHPSNHSRAPRSTCSVSDSSAMQGDSSSLSLPQVARRAGREWSSRSNWKDEQSCCRRWTREWTGQPQGPAPC